MTAAPTRTADRGKRAAARSNGHRPPASAGGCPPRKTVVDGVEITLAVATSHPVDWIDYNEYARQLQAAWLRLSDVEPPLNSCLVGEPGLGKTTLACAVCRAAGREVYILQCTTDTRPEDLLVTPVLSADQSVEYGASPDVTAMLRGGALLLDEGNRMPERSWASLAPLMDDRRAVESTVAGMRIGAHRDFRMCVTMNEDASVYELPGYVQSRLKPQIEIVQPPWPIQREIVRRRCPGVDADLLAAVIEALERRARACAGPWQDTAGPVPGTASCQLPRPRTPPLVADPPTPVAPPKVSGFSPPDPGGDSMTTTTKCQDLRLGTLA